MRSNWSVVLVILSLFCQLMALVFGKYAALQSNGVLTVRDLLGNAPYLASLACLGVQAVVWPLALRRLPLFWAYLVMSGVYVAIPLVSWSIFHEIVSVANMLGAGLIMAGIIVMTCGGKEAVRV